MLIIDGYNDVMTPHDGTDDDDDDDGRVVVTVNRPVDQLVNSDIKPRQV